MSFWCFLRAFCAVPKAFDALILPKGKIIFTGNLFSAIFWQRSDPTFITWPDPWTQPAGHFSPSPRQTLILSRRKTKRNESLWLIMIQLCLTSRQYILINYHTLDLSGFHWHYDRPRINRRRKTFALIKYLFDHNHKSWPFGPTTMGWEHTYIFARTRHRNGRKIIIIIKSFRGRVGAVRSVGDKKGI